MAATEPDLVAETHTERARLVALLEDLDADQWATPSLCDGWRVREVVAHITMAYRTSTFEFIRGLVLGGFSFSRQADRDARNFALTTADTELLDLLRRNIRHPWTPPGGGQAGALAHDVIHGVDITEPLGLQAAPPHRIALAMQGTQAKQLKHFGVNLGEIQLEATDTDLVIGHGTPRRASAKDILLVATGRRDLKDLDGAST